jgi:hypothetical protein
LSSADLTVMQADKSIMPWGVPVSLCERIAPLAP